MIRLPIQTCFPHTTWTAGNELIFARKRGVKKHIRQRANACVNILKQIGWLKPDQIPVAALKTVTFDPRRIGEFLTRQAYSIRGRFNVDELTIIMGHAQFNDLAHCRNDYMNQPLVLDCGHFGMNQWRGSMIIVLPWVEGVAFIPEKYLPIKTKIVEKLVPMTIQQAYDYASLPESERLGYLRKIDAEHGHKGH